MKKLILISTIVCFFFAAACTTALPASTSAPTQTVMSQPGTATTQAETPEVASPTFEPLPPTPTLVPDSWKRYDAIEAGISFRYPPEWKEESARRFSGVDGFVSVSVIDFHESLFDSIESFCVLAANFDPATSFGKYPQINEFYTWVTSLKGAETRGCTVSPYGGAESNAEAVLYARIPLPQMKDKLLVLRSDSAHFAPILTTLSYPEPPPLPTQSSCEPKQHTDARVALNAAVSITEYPIADASCDLKNNIFAFNFNSIGVPLDAELALSLTEGRRQQAEIDNLALAPFGYRLEENPGSPLTFKLYRGDTLVVASLYRLGPVSVNEAGTDFILWVQDNLSNSAPIEVSVNGTRTLTVWYGGFNTVWVGNDQVGYEYSKEHLFPVGAPGEVNITRNGKVVRTYAVSQAYAAAGYPVYQFGAWDGHWMLEMNNVVLQDGVPLNQTLGYPEIFEWTLMKEKPFFFFQKDGKYGISYDAAELAIRYDDIIHGMLCCDPGLYSIKTTPVEAWFYALRGETWYLVHLEAK